MAGIDSGSFHARRTQHVGEPDARPPRAADRAETPFHAVCALGKTSAAVAGAFEHRGDRDPFEFFRKLRDGEGKLAFDLAVDGKRPAFRLDLGEPAIVADEEGAERRDRLVEKMRVGLGVQRLVLEQTQTGLHEVEKPALFCFRHQLLASC